MLGNLIIQSIQRDRLIFKGTDKIRQALFKGTDKIRQTKYGRTKYGMAERHSTDVLAIADRQIASALKYIREHACDDGMDVESLLRAIPLSRSVMERRFSQILGSSPKGEILRVRLGRVCQLLAESDLTLAAVAKLAGFDHPEYMSRLFRKKMGITPGEFRKQAGGLPLL